MDLLNGIWEFSRIGLGYAYAPGIIKGGIFYLNAYISICAVASMLVFFGFAATDIAWNRTTVSNVFAGFKEGCNFVIFGGDRAYYIVICLLSILSPAFSMLFVGLAFLFSLNYECS